ncbi:MAG: hypothetical protein ABIH76_05935, partial [Candidatus Bathyarchaeota archaeon]
ESVARVLGNRAANLPKDPVDIAEYILGTVAMYDWKLGKIPHDEMKEILTSFVIESQHEVLDELRRREKTRDESSN